jgi:hypothetical protein
LAGVHSRAEEFKRRATDFIGPLHMHAAIFELARLFPIILDQCVDQKFLWGRAHNHYVHTSTYRGETYFLERCWVLAVTDWANKGGKDLFQINFPHIDNLLVSRLHKPIPTSTE